MLELLPRLQGLRVLALFHLSNQRRRPDAESRAPGIRSEVAGSGRRLEAETGEEGSERPMAVPVTESFWADQNFSTLSPLGDIDARAKR